MTTKGRVTKECIACGEPRDLSLPYCQSCLTPWERWIEDDVAAALLLILAAVVLLGLLGLIALVVYWAE